MHRQCRLAIAIGGEFLSSRYRNRRVTRDDFFNQTAHGFQPERERNNVEQQPVVTGSPVASQQIGLHRRAQGDNLVRIKIVQGLLLEKFADSTLYLRHARSAANHDHTLDFRT